MLVANGAGRRASAGPQGLGQRQASRVFLLLRVLPPWVSSDLRKKNAL